MIYDWLDKIIGICEVSVSGYFPERILNIAQNKGVIVKKIHKTPDGTLKFRVSKKGRVLLQKNLPENLSIKLVRCSGLPYLIFRNKKRTVMFILPILFIISFTVFSLFIWRVELTGGDARLQKDVRRVLKDNGVYIGALKHKIDRYDVKYNSILSVNDLSWIWVDIKGTTAYVNIKPRKPVPKSDNIKDPGNIISRYDGVVEKMQIFRGIPLVNEGDTVTKGQIVVSGTLSNENENIPTYYYHASGTIILRTWEEKSIQIPKKIYKKESADNKKTAFFVKNKKNKIIFSINSRISYAEYDKIDKNIKIPFLPFSFCRSEYHELKTKLVHNDVKEETKKFKAKFEKSIKNKKANIIDIQTKTEDLGNSVRVTAVCEYLIRADKEVPLKR